MCNNVLLCSHTNSYRNADFDDDGNVRHFDSCLSCGFSIVKGEFANFAVFKLPIIDRYIKDSN